MTLSDRASSSASRSSSDDETEGDEFPAAFRGRTFSHTKNPIEKKPLPIERPSSSGDSSATVRQGRSTFTRSRSPAIVRSSLTSKTSHSHRLLSPAFSRLNRPKSSLLDPVGVLPADIQLHIRIPFTPVQWVLVLPVPRFIEGILLLGSLLFAISRFPPFPTPQHPALSVIDSSKWISSGNVAN